MNPNEIQKKDLGKLKKLDENFSYKWDEKRGVPKRIYGKLTSAFAEDPIESAANFLKEFKGLFSLESPEKETLLRSINKDKAGNTHLTFQQMCKGYAVFGRELKVHITSGKIIKGISGKLSPKLNIPDKAKISGPKAIEAALRHDRKNKEIKSEHKPILVVYVNEDEKATLAWQLTVEGTDKGLDGKSIPALWVYFINSQDGKVVWRYNNLPTHSSTTGPGVGLYAGPVTLNTYHDHGDVDYKLDDRSTGTSASIKTYDADGGYPPSDLSSDSNNNWDAAQQGAEVDCHFFTKMTFDYYHTVHGRDSYDDSGADMKIYAHCGNNWNNAAWYPAYKHVRIGDGDGTDFDPLCSLDIIAHEWTHAVTEYTAGLIYYDESGALNESMSDVFASLIDGDWLIGEDCWLINSAPALRNMEDPTNSGQYDPTDPINSVMAGHQPDHINDQYTGYSDNRGVHINSGIMNKAAYLIATGGTHRGISVCEGLGRDRLGDLYYHALTNYLTSSSDFEDMKDAVLDSLDDLYIGHSKYLRWQASITNAFAAVGIGSEVLCPLTCWSAPYIPCVTAPHICPPAPFGSCPPAPFGCVTSPTACPPSPAICRVSPLVCPPDPGLCRLAPRLTCPPDPFFACPPDPMTMCPPSPIGCLPGPDPLPFDPEMIVRVPVKAKDQIVKVPGIGDVRGKLLNKNNIKTVEDYLKATDTKAKVKALAIKLKLSPRLLNGFRQKILMLKK
ncbi:MAG: M4 family metallopeptidase [Bacteroidales bacterium]|nr:M4 family metallopeptidase [Bacteroidales bacterium]